MRGTIFAVRNFYQCACTQTYILTIVVIQTTYSSPLFAATLMLFKTHVNYCPHTCRILIEYYNINTEFLCQRESLI